jgi:hypothetical protein
MSVKNIILNIEDKTTLSWEGLVLRVGIVKFLKYALNETKYACKLVA